MIDYGIMHGYVGKSNTVMIYPVSSFCIWITLLKIFLHSTLEKQNGACATRVLFLYVYILTHTHTYIFVIWNNYFDY